MKGMGVLNKYCNSSWKEVVELLQSNINRGLTEEEAINKRKELGDNKINLNKDNNFLKSFFLCFVRIYILFSIAISCFLIYKGNIKLSIISIIILLVNIIINITYCIENKRKSSYFEKINKATVKVLRDGEEKIIKSDDLVIGDIVIFKKSSLIGADLRIIDCTNLKVDEKNITGEKFLKEKFASKIDNIVRNTNEMKNMLFKGSVIKSGEGLGVVVSVGDSTELGKMITMISYGNNKIESFTKKMDKYLNLSYVLLFVAAILMYFAFGMKTNILMISLTLIASLPSVIASIIFLIMLKQELKSKYGIEIINISVLELIKNIQFIFLDKVGSITEKKMILSKIYTNGREIGKYDIDYDNDLNQKRAIDIMLLCNDAKYDAAKDEESGDIIECAFLKFAAENKIYKSILDNKYKRIFEIPMDTDKRILATVNECKKGFRANIRGNVDVVLSRCTHIMFEGIEKELTDEEREKIKAIDYNYSVAGLRTQGLAYRSFSYKPSINENIESNLVFVGITALSNPFKNNLSDELFELNRRDIKPVIFTDDNIIAATSFGMKSGIISDGSKVVSGVEIENLKGDEFIKAAGSKKIFSRITPEVKSKIISMFVKDDYEVACSGETLGDIPSLAMAKVGIGKGDVPEIVKKASDVYIKDNFLTGFLQLFKISNSVNNNIKDNFIFIISALIAEMFVVNISSLINKSTHFNMLIILNIFLLIPLSLIILNNDKENKSNIKCNIITTILWIVLPIFVAMDVKHNSEALIIMLLGLLFIEHIIADRKVSFKNINKNMLLSIISIIILFVIMTVLTFTLTIHYKKYQLIKLLITALAYFVFEIIMKIWSE